MVRDGDGMKRGGDGFDGERLMVMVLWSPSSPQLFISIKPSPNQQAVGTCGDGRSTWVADGEGLMVRD